MDTLVKLGEQDRLHQAVLDKLHSRLREAAEVAKERVNKQMGERYRKEGRQRGRVENEGSEVMEKAGEKEKAQQKVLGQSEKEAAVIPVVEEQVIEEIVIPAPPKNNPSEGPSKEDPNAWDPSIELTSILRRSPVIIFSKSYCPHSAAAKHILLTLYTLTPPPYIVELDQHPHGGELQAFLKEKTGRGTVPNVLVNGRSLGGGDEVKGLHGEGKLEGVLRRMAGKRLAVERVEGEEGQR